MIDKGEKMTGTDRENDLLIPERYPQGDLFICDVADAVLKDIMPQMEHPFYALSKKPEMSVRRYENNGNWIEILPSYKGLVTIYDKDILIYAVSQLIAKLNAGKAISRRIRITSSELLMFTNRGTSGRDYLALSDALDRLAGTRIKTNIITGNEVQTRNFGLINESTLHRKNGIDGRLLWIELELSSWVFNAIEHNQVLTLSRDYFRLRKPIERRIYELARKHCGHQKNWSISLELLHVKSGSQSNLRKFRFVIKEIIDTGHLPDYSLTFDDDSDKVTFINRGDLQPQPKNASKNLKMPVLATATYEKAKKAAPNYDVYQLEQEYRTWWERSEKALPDNINAAFIGFCKKKHQANPSP